MRRTRTDEIDCELILVQQHRAVALSDLVAAFFKIVACDNRCDVLLDRRFAASAAEALRPMIHR